MAHGHSPRRALLCSPLAVNQQALTLSLHVGNTSWARFLAKDAFRRVRVQPVWGRARHEQTQIAWRCARGSGGRSRGCCGRHAMNMECAVRFEHDD